MSGPIDVGSEETRFKCPNCGFNVDINAAACPNCGYQRTRNYWLNLLLLGIVVVPAAMAACSVGAVGIAVNLPDDPSSLGAGIMAMFSMDVAPIALLILWLLVHWQFDQCYRSKADLRSLLPATWILGTLSAGSAIVWLWCAYRFILYTSHLIFALIYSCVSAGIVWDMLRYHAKDKVRRRGAAELADKA